MTVKEFIDLLSNEVKECDRDQSELEFYVLDQRYDVDSIRAFSLSPDIIVELRSIENPLVTTARFKKEHADMVADTLQEIYENMIDEEEA